MEVCFGNHIYQCENELFRQVTGGGIGARVTGVVARILMDVWMDLLTQALKENEVAIYLLTKYVDDINVATSIIPKGYGWVRDGRKWVLRWSEDQEMEDRGKSKERSTMEKLRWIGDRLIPGLKLTIDLPENHESGKCPMPIFI